MGNVVSTPNQDHDGKENFDHSSRNLVERKRPTGEGFSASSEFKNIVSESIEFVEKTVALVTHPKSEKVEEIIRSAIKNTSFLSRLNEAEAETLVSAMTPYTAARGKTIIGQGDMGDYFYVIEKGKVDFIVNGKIVGTGASGRSFGEMAIFHNSLRAATCIASEDSVLWRVDRVTFRMAIACSVLRKQQETMEFLKTIDIMQDLDEEQLMRISDALEEKQFSAGATIVGKGTEGDEFFIIESGSVVVMDIGTGNHLPVKLGPGDFFGEKSLITGEDTAANVFACKACVLKCMTRQDFTNLMGPLWNPIGRREIKNMLLSVPIISEKNMSDDDVEILASLMIEGTFGEGTIIYKSGDHIVPTLYIIEYGKIMKSSVFGDVQLSVGDCFGEETLRSREESTVKVDATIRVLKKTKCLLLTRSAFSLTLFDRSNSFKRNSIFESVSVFETDVKPDRFQRHSLLHTGEFGNIWLVGDQSENGKLYALKRYRKIQLKNKFFVRERNILTMVDHPFIASMHIAFEDNLCSNLAFDFYPGGNLDSLMKKTCGLTENDAKFYAACVLEGMTYLHRRNIIYRGIAPENLLLDSKGYCVLNDFKNAKIIKSKTFTICGSPLYLAPEVILQRGHDSSCDIWSFGVLLYELICGYNPFSTNDFTGGIESICSGIVKYPEELFSTSCLDLMQSILQVQSRRRLGCFLRGGMDIREHKWFQSINFDLLVEKQLTVPLIPDLVTPENAISCGGAWDDIRGSSRRFSDSLTFESSNLELL